MSLGWLVGGGGDGDSDGLVWVKQLTITWYSRERHIQMHGQFFSSTPVDDY